MAGFLVGLGLSVFCLAFQAGVVWVIVRAAAWLTNGYSRTSRPKNFTVMMTISLITIAGHLTQMALWAAVFMACGEIQDFDTAYYYSADNFTTLGIGDIRLSPTWRLLAPMEAVNGILMFGISTAGVIAILIRLVDLQRKNPED